MRAALKGSRPPPQTEAYTGQQRQSSSLVSSLDPEDASDMSIDRLLVWK